MITVDDILTAVAFGTDTTLIAILSAAPVPVVIAAARRLGGGVDDCSSYFDAATFVAHS